VNVRVARGFCYDTVLVVNVDACRRRMMQRLGRRARLSFIPALGGKEKHAYGVDDHKRLSHGSGRSAKRPILVPA
jgi:hypothetical protein